LAQVEPERPRVLGVWFAALTITVVVVVLLVVIIWIMAIVFYKR
jgi:hypothetical protein